MTRRVGILGASGRLGGVAAQAVADADGFEAVPIDPRGDLAALSSVDVVFEATVPSESERFVRAAAAVGTPVVVGTSGWSALKIEMLIAEGVRGVRIVPNFSLGSVLGTHLSTIAARFFAAVEIIETHHQHKLDAPSGTAVRTAEAVAAVRGFEPATPSEPGRGAIIGGVPVHAVRLPGVSAQQQVIFGGDGETLTIQHDVLGHDAYRAGILLALAAPAPDGIVVGIDDLLGIA